MELSPEGENPALFVFKKVFILSMSLAFAVVVRRGAFCWNIVLISNIDCLGTALRPSTPIQKSLLVLEERDYGQLLQLCDMDILVLCAHLGHFGEALFCFRQLIVANVK